jgi:nitroreductase
MDVQQLLGATRSARKSPHLETAVYPAEITGYLRIGLQAGSGSNQQNRRWLIVVDRALREQIPTPAPLVLAGRSQT